MDKKRLTPKQELFCQEYLKDLNATQAYKRAGYKARTDKTAQVESSKLLSKPIISARIEQLKAKRIEKVQVDSEWVLRKLIEVVDMSMKAEPVVKYDNNAQKMVETGEFVFDSKGANRALELIGKHIGTFDPKHGKISNLTDKQIAKIEAETKFIQERTKLLQGATKDTSLMEALIKAVKGEE